MAATTPTADESMAIAKHEKLFFEIIIFRVSCFLYSVCHCPNISLPTEQVDKTLFKVPARYFHDKSGVFGTASNISAGLPGGEGSSEENPIDLSPLPYDATMEDFECLVRIIWALCVWFISW